MLKIIEESENLDYDKNKFHVEDYDKTDISKCILQSFGRPEKGLELHFENGKHATITPKTSLGYNQINDIERGLKNFIGKFYEEILNTDFGPKVSRIPEY